MSCNIHFVAKRTIYIPSIDKDEEQEIYFNVWQTSSEETRQIQESDDHIQSYKEWVMSRNIIDQYPVYEEEDDFFCENPIGYKEINVSQEHIETFNQWLESCQENGYTIEAEYW